MKNNRHLSIYNVFLDLMKCFITACGSVLLIIFFYGGDIEITRQLIRSSVYSIFSFLIMMTLFYRLSIKCFHKDKTFSSLYNGEDVAQLIKTVPENDTEKLLLEIASIHEAGHTVVALKLGIEVISVRAAIDRGYTETSGRFNGLMTTEDLKNYAVMSYGGAAAEKVIFGKIRAGSTGSETSDFTVAEDLIKQMLLISNKTVGYTYFGENLIQKYSVDLFDRAEQIVSENKDTVQKLAKELQSKGKLNGDEIRMICGIGDNSCFKGEN